MGTSRNNIQCPCHSGKLYRDCCQPYHLGQLPQNALFLMRSRYAAYALHLADYIMATTHPHNPAFTLDKQGWRRGILDFCQRTRFIDLKIHEFIDGADEAYVTFTAQLTQADSDASFKEKSRFLKEAGRWLYESGVVTPK